MDLKAFRRRILLFLLKWRSRVAAFGSVRRLDYAGADLRIQAESVVEFETRARSMAKEPETAAWLEAHAGPQAVLYDVGANIGAYSLVAASKGARVFAFEPAFQNFAALQRNLTMNGLDAKVDAFPIALTDATKLVRFKFLDLASGTSKCWYNEKDFYALPHGRPLTEKGVLAFSLDEFAARFALPAPTMLKIDVDGGEADVVTGAAQTLRRPELKTVIVEIDDATGDRERIFASLAEAGLRHQATHPRGRGVFNHVFVRP